MPTQTSTVTNNYTVGRGTVYFAPFVAGTQTPQGEAFLGDCNALSVTIKATQLDHYQSTGGVKTIDQSATIQSDSSGSLATENASNANLALFFFGAEETVTTVAATVTDEVVSKVVPGLFYQLGTAADPVGARGLDDTTAIIVKSSDSITTYAAGTDYVMDYVLGRLQVVSGGAIVSGSDLKVTYKTKVTTRNRVISGETPIEGQLRFISDNTVGEDKDMLIPWVKLSPNGNHELIGDKYTALTFDLKVLKKTGLPSLYIDGRAA